MCISFIYRLQISKGVAVNENEKGGVLTICSVDEELGDVLEVISAWQVHDFLVVVNLYLSIDSSSRSLSVSFRRQLEFKNEDMLVSQMVWWALLAKRRLAGHSFLLDASIISSSYYDYTITRRPCTGRSAPYTNAYNELASAN